MFEGGTIFHFTLCLFATSANDINYITMGDKRFSGTLEIAVTIVDMIAGLKRFEMHHIMQKNSLKKST